MPRFSSRSLVQLWPVLLIAAMIWLSSSLLPMQPIDYTHYMAASWMILHGTVPYGQVEFFAPPWIAFFTAPLLLLPAHVSAMVWLYASILCIGATILVSAEWENYPTSTRARNVTIVLSAIIPPAFVGFAIVQVASQLRAFPSRIRQLQIILGFMLMTLKPHIVALPALLCFLQLVRNREWRTMSLLVLALMLLSIPTFVLLPDWPRQLLFALQEGAYRGGPGLVARGYAGLQELGVPVGMLVPLAIYVLFHWWQHGLTSVTLSLALAANLMVVPYNRTYDYIILILPALVATNHSPSLIRSPAAVLALVSVALIPITPVAVLAPVLVEIDLMIRILSESPSIDSVRASK